MLKVSTNDKNNFLKIYYSLFLYGVDKIFDVFVVLSEYNRMDERNEKLVLEWRNKIKRNTQPDSDYGS